MANGRVLRRQVGPVPVALACAAIVVVGLLGGCSSNTTSKPKPPGCPDVQAVFVPGTGETQVGADPAVPVGLLKAVSEPIRDSVDANRAGIYFVPYIANFPNPIAYQASEQAGVRATTEAIAATAAKCPEARFTLAGYSQGAAVAGDVATQ
ncbi:MAG: cutinase family protein, partial [Mycobacteriaceae bacterium]